MGFDKAPAEGLPKGSPPPISYFRECWLAGRRTAMFLRGDCPEVVPRAGNAACSP